MHNNMLEIVTEKIQNDCLSLQFVNVKQQEIILTKFQKQS